MQTTSSAIQQRSEKIQTRNETLPAELQNEIDAMMREDKGVAYDPLPLRAHIEKDRFWVTQRGNKEPIKKYEQLDVHIVDARKWRGAYGSREQKAPSCASPDAGRTGKLHPEFGALLPIKITDGQECSICLLNQWGTGKDEAGSPTRGKFCGERRNLLALCPDFDDPIVVSIPTMSVSRWDAYVDGLVKVAKTHFSTQMTRIGVEMVERDSQTEYGAAVFETLGYLPAETIAGGIALRKQFKAMLGAIVVEEQVSAPEEREMPF